MMCKNFEVKTIWEAERQQASIVKHSENGADGVFRNNPIKSIAPIYLQGKL